MIKENQELLNKFNILLDGFLIFVSMPFAYWIRFSFFSASLHKLEFDYYLVAVICLLPVQLAAFKGLGLYEAQRKKSAIQEISRMTWAAILCFSCLPMVFFLAKIQDFSRGVLAAFLVLEVGFLGSKRLLTRLILRTMRRRGYNRKYVLIVGSGKMAQQCEKELTSNPELGYAVQGYISYADCEMESPRLGNIWDMEMIIESYRPDEVLAALEVEDYDQLPMTISACEASGVRFSLVPCYAKYIPVRPQVDSLNGIPLLNLRRIPLDNMANAFIKRTMDIVGALLLIVLTSPLMIVAAIGVKLSSPGPIIFRQERVGREKRNFYMYKFRSMRVNDSETTGWSTNTDPRRTRFGSFIRKYSIDELPQFFNVLKGDMSLVGPRPELPHFVEQFRDEVPMYMVKHQVRPGITGWAQVHGLRGDTSIEKRIRHDLYYIENWSPILDIVIMLRTLACLKNSEQMTEEDAQQNEESSEHTVKR